MKYPARTVHHLIFEIDVGLSIMFPPLAFSGLRVGLQHTGVLRESGSNCRRDRDLHVVDSPGRRLGRSGPGRLPVWQGGQENRPLRSHHSDYSQPGR